MLPSTEPTTTEGADRSEHPRAGATGLSSGAPPSSGLAATAPSRSEAILRRALAASRIGVWEWCVADDTVYWSPEAFEIVGRKPESFRGTLADFTDLVHPDDRAGLAAEVERTLAGHTERDEFAFDFRVVRPDGSLRWLRDHAVVERDASGGPLRLTGTVRDITAEREIVRARSEEVTAILDATPAAVWIAQDRGCTDVRGSRAGYEMLRASPGTNLSKTGVDPAAVSHFTVWSDGVELKPEELPLQRAAREGVAVRDFEEELRFADGTRLQVYGHAVPLRAPDGAVRGAIAAFVDVTRLKEAERVLREAASRKDEFLAMLSHELRDPLAAVRTSLEVLRQVGGDPVAGERAMSVMERQLGHMIRLIDDLLDVSRIAHDKLDLKLENLDLAAAVRDLVEAFRPRCREAGHELTVSIPAEPIHVHADPARLAQVLSNILTNACKYTPSGGRLSVAVRLQDEHAEIAVADTGVGIPPEMLPQVFDLFTQVDRSLERSEGGLGIGLALAKQLAEMQGGSVVARSQGLGRGSEFVVRLPAVAGAKPAPAKPSRAAAAAPVVPSKVLIVDDNRDSAESLSMFLSMSGHQTEVAFDGFEAIDRARAFQPDTIVLDIGLPGRSGLDTCRVIRAEPWGRDLRIIAMTGWGQDDDRRQSREAGFDAHVLKPVEPTALLRLLATLERRDG